MLQPDKVKEAAKRKEKQNYKFLTYLKCHADEYGINYQTKHKPCDFLQADGNCKLGDCKPESCKKYMGLDNYVYGKYIRKIHSRYKTINPS